MMFRQYCFIILYLLFSYSCLAQKVSLEKVENVDASKYKPIIVELETKKKYSATTHFKYAIIIDKRADKSKMGIAKVGGEKPVNLRFDLPEDLSIYLQENVNRLSDPAKDAEDTAIFVINNLWLYQTMSPGSSLKQQALGVSNNMNSNCFINIDCYIMKSNAHYWICNVDTTLTMRGYLPNQCNRILTEAISSAISYSDSIFFNNKYSGTALNREQIESSYNSRFNYPILSVERYSKGTFTTYADFLENKINTTEIEVYYDKNKRHIRSKSIADSLISQSWGFSDGESLFINIEGSFYKLIRSGNTFDLMGPRIIEHKNTMFNKTVSAVISYFFISPIVAPLAFFEPDVRRFEQFKLYQLNIRDGIFR